MRSWLTARVMPLVPICFFVSKRKEGRETVFTCLYPYTVQTRPLAGTASGMASDSVRGRGNICGADLEIKSKRGDGTLLIFEASA